MIGLEITFVVSGKVVGKNQAYTSPHNNGSEGNNGSRPPRWKVLTSEARAYKRKISESALAARMNSNWPTNPWMVAGVTISVTTYNNAHDSDAKTLLLSDALQGILYGNDRVVGWGPNPRPIIDDGEPRLVVTVRLDETHSPEMASYLRDDEIRRETNKVLRKMGVETSPKKKPPKSVSVG